MKKTLLVLALIALALPIISCVKPNEQTTTQPITTEEQEHFEPYTDEDGNLVVDVSDYEFPDEIFEPK